MSDHIETTDKHGATLRLAVIERHADPRVALTQGPHGRPAISVLLRDRWMTLVTGEAEPTAEAMHTLTTAEIDMLVEAGEATLARDTTHDTAPALAIRARLIGLSRRPVRYTPDQARAVCDAAVEVMRLKRSLDDALTTLWDRLAAIGIETSLESEDVTSADRAVNIDTRHGVIYCDDGKLRADDDARIRLEALP